ncbi:MAG: FxsA family protein [Hyphomicrobiaceae bacterium]|nr:FxsA family protein [Hyphomicrobiaceae bacterium]
MLSPVRAIMLLVFVAIPLLEIVLLIKVGQSIGFWWTVLIVVATAVVGTSLLHRQGLETLRRLMASTEAGSAPVQTLVEGALLLASGFLLLTPGLITDTFGFILLVPPLRSFLARHVVSKAIVVVRNGGWTQGPGPDEDEPRSGGPRGPRQGPRDDGDGIVIEGEYERLDERTVDPNRRRP